jgi:hypothetical protein
MCLDSNEYLLIIMDESILFSEKQYFRQWWIWIILFLIFAQLGFGIYSQIFKSTPFGNNPMSDSGLLLTASMMLVFISLFMSMHLNTKITKDCISVKFFPFRLKYRDFKWEEIDKIYCREYKPLLEFGGWGLRGIGDNRALNVSGNKGIQIIFKNGNRLLIGTNKYEESKKIIESLNLSEQ